MSLSLFVFYVGRFCKTISDRFSRLHANLRLNYYYMSWEKGYGSRLWWNWILIKPIENVLPLKIFKILFIRSFSGLYRKGCKSSWTHFKTKVFTNIILCLFWLFSSLCKPSMVDEITFEYILQLPLSGMFCRYDIIVDQRLQNMLTVNNLNKIFPLSVEITKINQTQFNCWRFLFYTNWCWCWLRIWRYSY